MVFYYVLQSTTAKNDTKHEQVACVNLIEAIHCGCHEYVTPLASFYLGISKYAKTL